MEKNTQLRIWAALVAHLLLVAQIGAGAFLVHLVLGPPPNI